MRLAIITINYNGSESTIRLLKSLDEQSDKDLDVIIIDNASEKSDFDNLRQAINMGTLQSKVPMLIRNEQNLGFSGGNNVGIRQALNNGADWVLLLNNDTSVDKDFVERLKVILSSKTGILGVSLDEEEHMAYCGKVLWLKPQGYHIHDRSRAESEKDKYIIGGAMAIHKDVFKKVGLLDERYFLYFEDADFSLRVLRAGFPLSFTDDITVHHQVSSTTKKLGNPLLLRYHYRNALYFNWHNGPWYIKLLVWPWSFWIIGKQFLKILFLIHQEESRQIMIGVLDFWFSRMGKIK